MKRALLVLCLLSPNVWACDTHLPLSGMVSVATCPPDKGTRTCVASWEALSQYLEAMPDHDDDFTIALQSSPWRMYDGNWRILTPEDLAGTVRATREKKHKRVELVGSWTGVSPAPGIPSLAERLSKALGGFPVQGENGFLWISKDGARRTTRQAFTGRQGSGPYFIPAGAELFVPLVTGWQALGPKQAEDADAEQLLQSGAAWDVMYLCPEKAQQSFELAASKGNVVAAYNAALMRLERGGNGNRSAAIALLKRAAAQGDAKSQARLKIELAKR
ncbi:hypothetical protein LL974_06095 [Xanthomonas campestris pv. cannae]|nr:hypothetical protein [Xanthomonas campestris pv. cannae]